MSSPMRWLTLAMTGLCLVIVQAFQYQATELDELRRQRGTHYTAIAEVEAELAPNLSTRWHRTVWEPEFDLSRLPFSAHKCTSSRR